MGKAYPLALKHRLNRSPKRYKRAVSEPDQNPPRPDRADRTQFTNARRNTFHPFQLGPPRAGYMRFDRTTRVVTLAAVVMAAACSDTYNGSPAKSVAAV